jgi:hypothetical protein
MTKIRNSRQKVTTDFTDYTDFVLAAEHTENTEGSIESILVYAYILI